MLHCNGMYAPTLPLVPAAGRKNIKHTVFCEHFSKLVGPRSVSAQSSVNASLFFTCNKALLF